MIKYEIRDALHFCNVPLFRAIWEAQIRGALPVIGATITSVSSLFAILSPIAAVCGDAEKESGIFFSVPVDCSLVGRKGIRLGHAFSEGLNVVLLGAMESCRAKTRKTFTAEYFDAGTYGPDALSKETYLVYGDECSAAGDNKMWSGNFRTAVVSADPPTVHLIQPKDDTSPVPREIESKARRLVEFSEWDPCSYKSRRVGVGIADSWPEVIRAENVALLMFHLIVFAGEPEENGPAVLVVDNHVFRLTGCCQRGPLFFSVNDKLHLAYEESRCWWRCGEQTFVVYDLSSGRPEVVFRVSTDID